jgi:hypothetical protein
MEDETRLVLSFGDENRFPVEGREFPVRVLEV